MVWTVANPPCVLGGDGGGSNSPSKRPPGRIYYKLIRCFVLASGNFHQPNHPKASRFFFDRTVSALARSHPGLMAAERDVSPSKIREHLHRSHRRVTASMAASRGADCPRVLYVPSYRRFWVTPLPPMPRHFGRTVVVFRRYRPPLSVKKEGSSSRELGSPPEFVVPASARSSRAPSLGSPTSSRHRSSESTADGHPRPVYVPPSAFRTLSTVYSSLDLADLFHPAATSRFLAPGASSPDLTATTSSVALAFAPLAPPSCRRLPDDAGERRVDLKAFSRPGSAAPTEVLAPPNARVPSCASAPSGSLHQS
jgi:hypothetical protein